MEITEETLKRYCDNARAYGWECGARSLVGKALPGVIESSAENPFVHPDWDAHLKDESVGFMLSAGEVPL